MAQALVKAGALDGLSIGFRAVKARADGRLRILTEVELWEVSLVSFPMLPGARLRVGQPTDTTNPVSLGLDPRAEPSVASRWRG